MEIDTISFYYFAWRLRMILCQMPGLQQLQLPDIRNIRHHLIEHSERKDSKVLVNSFSWDTRRGCTLKDVRPLGQDKWLDQGLFHNVVSMKEEIERKIKIFLASSSNGSD